MGELLVIGICLVLNGLLAGVEMAFVTVGKPRLRDLARSGNQAASQILRLRENPERTLSVLQIGITLVGAIAAAVGGAGAEESLNPILQREFGLSPDTGEVIAIVVVVLPIAYLSVVVGELVPKTLALKNPLKIVLFSARWLVLFERLLAPAVTALEWSTRLLLRPVLKRLRPEPAAHQGDETVELDGLSLQTRQYVLNLVNIEKARVREIYLPWNQVICVQARQPIDEVEGVALASGHTRLPVVRDTETIGIINTKELMPLRKSGAEHWDSIIRPLVQVQETDSLLRALRLMQEKRSHLSVVYAGTKQLGIVTMEDILEEVIGDIFDEDDDGALRRILSTAAKFRATGPLIR